MKNLIFKSMMVFVLCFGIIAGGLSHAQQDRTYEVTITNVTRGQIITPPVVIMHNGDFELFTLGEPAIPELAALAEDGVTDPLVDYLATLSSVWGYAVGSGPIMPGSSATIEVTTQRRYSYFSVVGMLAVTNDAIVAVRGMKAPHRGELMVEADAYDAGSEANSESCTYIPGPPCGNAEVRDTDDAEGFVHVHAGVHGIGDLDPAMHDWRNPVAEITIERVSQMQ